MSATLQTTTPTAKTGRITKQRTRPKRIPSPLLLLLLLVIVCTAAYLYMSVQIDPNHVDYAIKLRKPKLFAMIISGFCIGAASIAFQSIVNNHIITPSLLGMNSLYSLVHTSVFFFLGSTSYLATHKNASFLFNLALMALVSTVVYGYMFKKTKYNVLYILLAGTVIGHLFSSITSTLIRSMDPNEFESLQNKLIASFSRANTELIVISTVLVVVVSILFAKEISYLNVITLGRNQAINLGIPYDWSITKLLVAVALYVSIATALVGPISFLGLVVANVTRFLFKTYRHSYLLLGAGLVSITILLTGQTLIEHVFGFQTTIAVFVNIFGGLYFLFLVATAKKR